VATLAAYLDLATLSQLAIIIIIQEIDFTNNDWTLPSQVLRHSSVWLGSAN
jgi:hypothetical protein